MKELTKKIIKKEAAVPENSVWKKPEKMHFTTTICKSDNITINLAYATTEIIFVHK